MAQPTIVRKSQAESGNVHRLTPAQKQEVAQKLDPDEKALLRATAALTRWQGLAAGLVMGALAGWFAYDMSVKAVSDTLQDQAIKSEIAKQIARESVR